MPWVRRTRHLSLSADDDDARVAVRSLLTGRRLWLTADELEALLAVPVLSSVSRNDGDPLMEVWAREGLILSDAADGRAAKLRRRDDELTSRGWWPDAAALHAGARWEGVRARVPQPDGSITPRRVDSEPALTPFPDRGGERTALAWNGAASPLRQLLARRRTVRRFDESSHVDASELAVLLRWVWGAHGTLALAGHDVGLRRTSPSGGSLHPVEVYPLVRRVEGVASGLYHYLGGEHALEAVAQLDTPGVAALVEAATAGQWFFAGADVAFVMTARFGRSFRKYRRHAKAYRTIFLDAGHLSQSFYLLCTELGLGPWVTAALDESVLEQALALDPLEEGVIALCGCGRPKYAPEPDFLHPSFVPLFPGGG
jgi:putative peptide maturation dehydrogenase